MTYRIISLALALGLGTSSARAAEPAPEALTLEAAIELAVEQARAMILVRADRRRADLQRDRAIAAVLPSLDVVFTAQERFRDQPIVEFRGPVFCDSSLSSYADCQSTNDFVEGPFVDRQQLNDASEPRFDLVLVARQLIYDGGRSWAQISRAGHQRARLDALYQAVFNNVRLDVARRFYGLASAERAQETFQFRVELGEAQLYRARVLLEEGRGQEADVANAARNLAEDRVTLARRAFAAARQRRALNLALARPADTPVRLRIPAEISTASVALPRGRRLSRDQVKQTVLRNRPDLVATRQLVKVVEQGVVVQDARYGPVISLDARYQRGSRRPDRVFGSWHENFSASMGVTVRWNLFEGLRTRSLVAEAEQDVIKAEADLEDLERRVVAEALDRLENFELQVQVFDLARDAQGSAKQAVDLARELFEKGKSTALELRDSELKHTNAQLAVINARLQVEVAREELRRACGVDLLGGLHP